MKQFQHISILVAFTLLSLVSLAQPANDFCSGAQTITPDGSCVNGTTVNAGDNLIGVAGCQAGGNQNNHNDVWYSFVATGTEFEADVTSSAPFSGNVELVLLSGSCGGTLFLEGSSCGPSPLNANISGLNVGQSYLILISNQGNGTAGPFELCVNNSTPSCTPTTCPSPQALPISTGVQTCTTECNTGASPGPDFLGNNCYDYPGPTYWIEVTTPSDAATLNIDINSADLSNPYFTLFTTSDCQNYVVNTCTQGSGGAVSNTISVTPNTTYLIAVSDLNGASGDFELCVTPNLDNSACATDKTLEVTSTSMGSPLTGPYLPGEVVTFCFTIDEWTLANCNYLQGIVPTFGDCWDPVSFDAQGRPVNITQQLQTIGVLNYPPPRPSCHGDPAGTWSWFPSGTVTYNNINNPNIPNGTNVGAGWFFLTSYDPLTGLCNAGPSNPNNSYGDANFTSCAGPLSGWQVCFQLQTQSAIACKNGELDCSVSIKTYADGEIGVWDNIGCMVDESSVFNANLYCCPASSNTVDTVICFNEYYRTAGGDLVNIAGTYIDTLIGADVNGCDSIVTQELSVIPEKTFTIDTGVCFGAHIIVNGVVYDTDVTGATQVISNVGPYACDSTIYINLNVFDLDSTYEFQTSCNPADTGVVVLNFMNQDGCDSLHFITTTLELPVYSNQNITACDSVRVLGEWYSSATAFNDTVFGGARNGCDSIVEYTITINNSISTSEARTTCNPQEAGVETFDYTRQNGCDSIHTITTTLLPSDSTFETQTSCFPQDTGEVVLNLNNQYGCDSVHTITTTLFPSDSTFENQTSCNPSDTGVVVLNLNNQYGCDSVHTITTTLLPSDSTFENQTSCNPSDTG
ncbi:MAG: hypothetical protein WD048_17120, partial [Chitinophagales bacterium]